MSNIVTNINAMFMLRYHHLVTLAMSWLTAPYVEAISRWYVVMNYGVHRYASELFLKLRYHDKITHFEHFSA